MFYICFLFLILATSTICELLCSNASHEHVGTSQVGTGLLMESLAYRDTAPRLADNK